jgi:hypothetical protein
MMEAFIAGYFCVIFFNELLVSIENKAVGNRPFSAQFNKIIFLLF